MDRDTVLQALLEDKEVRKVLELLAVVLALLRNYGKKLMLPNFIKGIEKINRDIADLIYLLDGINLLEEKELSRFIRDLKAKVEKKYLDFTLYTNEEKTIPPLKKFLEKKFGKEAQLHFQEIPSDNLTVTMKGHGYLFDRSLENDIDKLLA